MQQSIAAQPHSEKWVRQRKFLLWLPVFAIPLITFLLWSVGVIGSEGSGSTTATKSGGLNMTLPEPVPSKDSTWNKLNFYEQADKDAAKLASLMKNDPYYSLPLTETAPSMDTGLLPISTKSKLGSFGEPGISGSLSNNMVGGSRFNYDPYPSGLQSYKDPNETKVYQKLAELDAALNRNTVASEKQISYTANESSIGPSVNTADIDRLESMMQMMQGDEAGGDPELERINGMLDKILQIQHPDKIATEIKEQSIKNKGQVFTIGLKQEDNVSLLEAKRSSGITASDTLADYATQQDEPQQRNGFYSLDNEQVGFAEQPNAIEAVIHETQTLVSGATVKLRLLSDVYINGLLIPKDQLVFGMSSLNGERLEINITSIRYGNNILPVALSVYDIDGIAGIYMPGSITRDASKQSTDQAIQSLGIASLDPSLGAQAASAGITAAKSLLSKKTKLVKVTVKAGYQVLLKDDNRKNQ